MPKDVVVPDIAEWYQKHGFTALIFDTYGIGASDGEPRHDVSYPGSYDYIPIYATQLTSNCRDRATCKDGLTTSLTRSHGFLSTL